MFVIQRSGQMINDSNKAVEFLGISQPTSKGDRVLTEE
jgi:hypothetical protein